jgi:putative flippase GtrA
MKEMLGRGRSSRLGVRFGRYTLGSVVALATSEVAFVVCYGTGRLGTTASSAVAFVAGAIPNYVLNRSWAFGRRGRVRVGREVVLYAVVSLVSFAASALATGWMSHIAPHVTTSHDLRTALVAGAYLATYGVLFVAKFLVFQVVIFADTPLVSPPPPTPTVTPPAAPAP